VKVWLPTGIALLAAAVLQAALAPHMAIGTVEPNFLLLVVIVLSMVEGPIPGAVAGFVAGLLFDLLGSGPIGAGALVMTSVGFIAGSMRANIFAKSWLLPVTIVFVASFLAELAYGIFLAVIGVETQLMPLVWTVMLPSAVYDTVLALLVFPWLARFLRSESEMTEFKGLR
jgi:rod shape-determining protein MreD